jgi:uncharacterized protein
VINERAIVFDCGGESLVGMLHAPEVAAEIGVVVVVGGPQYRVGSHRQFVHLARAVSRAGYPVLRFDVRGMGDSSGAPRPFDSLDDDIAAAIDAVVAHTRSVRRVVLWGLCDGASAAWLYLQARGDPRVAGVCAVNPWVRSSQGLARTHIKHYYLQRVLSPSFWSKLLRGGVGWQALRKLVRALWTTLSPGLSAEDRSPADFRQRMAQGCHRCAPGSVLLMLSSDDYTAKEFAEHAASAREWQEALRACAVQRRDIPGADHTLSQQAARIEVEVTTVRWLDDLRAGNSRNTLVGAPARFTGQLA